MVYDLSINENRGIIIIIDVLPQENYLWQYFFPKIRYKVTEIYGKL